MKPSQLAVTTMCYCDFPLERALAGIASCGITRVELCASVGYCDHAPPERLGSGGAGELTRSLNRHGMRAISLSAHADITTETGLRAVTARLNIAADSGIPILITPSLPLERTEPGLADRFRRLIVELAEQAARHQMTLCLQPKWIVPMHYRLPPISGRLRPLDEFLVRRPQDPLIYPRSSAVILPLEIPGAKYPAIIVLEPSGYQPT